MVLDSIEELASGFEGCEKKLEIDFCINNNRDPLKIPEDEESVTKQAVDLRQIPRSTIDQILSLARCTIISKQTNRDFDAYVLSESSLFIYPAKIILKTCGTTLLLKTLSALLSACRTLGAEPDFLQFSRSNFLFPSKQHFPHTSFNEEVAYLNSELGVEGEAFILGSLNGARWHLYIWDFNRVDAKEYRQQTLEVLMFNLDTEVMKTFYKQPDEFVQSNNQAANGQPCKSGEEATRAMRIDELLPNSLVDSHLFTPCGYSCNGCATLDSHKQSTSAVSLQGNQGFEQQAYFTIHITPEPECSFVSFETNAVLSSYTSLVRAVINTFKPGSFCVSLFVDGEACISDSRAGLVWDFDGYTNRGTSHHRFAQGYNATVSQFQAATPTITPRQQH